MTNSIKPHIDAQGMREINSLSADILAILENRIPDIAIDQCQFDIDLDEEAALDDEIAIEEFIAGIIIQKIKGVWC
jgi:hypothetical protein